MINIWHSGYWRFLIWKNGKWTINFGNHCSTVSKLILKLADDNTTFLITGSHELINLKENAQICNISKNQ